MRRLQLISFFFFLILNGAAQSLAIRPDLYIVPLAPNALLHISYSESETFGKYSSNGLIYIHHKEAIVLDTPPDDTLSMALLSWFEKSYPEVKIKGVIAHHFHDDCMGGKNAFESKGIKVYAHYLTREMAEINKKPVPDVLLTDHDTLWIGSLPVITFYPGEGHSRDNIVTYIPELKIVFGGCMIKALGSGKGNLSDANVQKWSDSVKRVRKTFAGAKIIIPGHGPPGNRRLLQYTIRMFYE